MTNGTASETNGITRGTNGDGLLSCPFCGGEAKLYDDYSSGRDEHRWQVWHVCDSGPEGESAGYGEACHTSIDTPWFKSREKAVEAWNTRVAVTEADFARAVHDGELWGKCSECKERQGYYLDAETIQRQQEHIEKLTVERDAYFEMVKRVQSDCDARDELIRDMWPFVLADGASEAFAERMRELGIEARP